MSTDKKAVCLYLPTETIEQIDQLATDMKTTNSGAVILAVNQMFDNKENIEVPLKLRNEIKFAKEVYDILDHIKDAMNIQLHLVAFAERTQQVENEIKLYNLLIDRAKHGMALIKKK